MHARACGLIVSMISVSTLLLLSCHVLVIPALFPSFSRIFKGNHFCFNNITGATHLNLWSDEYEWLDYHKHLICIMFRFIMEWDKSKTCLSKACPILNSLALYHPFHPTYQKCAFHFQEHVNFGLDVSREFPEPLFQLFQSKPADG